MYVCIYLLNFVHVLTFKSDFYANFLRKFPIQKLLNKMCLYVKKYIKIAECLSIYIVLVYIDLCICNRSKL